MLASVPSAGADADPASDVLAASSVFLPSDAGIGAGRQAELQALLDAAHRRGYGLRLAIVSSRTDLGPVTSLWGQPQSHARFLGEELSLVFRAPLLVVMPAGYGLHPAAAGAGGAAALRRLAPPGQALDRSAEEAIRRLASARGLNLPFVQAAPVRVTSSSSLAQWLVFLLGCGMVAAAWIASLRARPLGRGRSRRPG